VKRKQLDWVANLDSWGSLVEFSGSSAFVLVPLTLWQASQANTVPTFPGLFESGTALTVERVRGKIIWGTQRSSADRPDPNRVYQMTMRLRVGEMEMEGAFGGQPSQPITYDMDDPSWANEDFLWEERGLHITEAVQTEDWWSEQIQFRVHHVNVDCKSRRRLEPPDQLQLALGWIVAGAQPTNFQPAFAYMWLRVLLSDAT